MKKIEKNKKLRDKQKARESKQKAAKRRTIEQRQFKREVKARIIPVPENNVDEFIDKTIIENGEDQKVNDVSNNVLKLVPSSLEGFTVLGADNFAQKKKVRINVFTSY